VIKKTGTKREVLDYIQSEVGNEIEFSWMTRTFFLQAQLKSENIGEVIKILANAEFL
jgi:hypothetical protein